MEMMSDDAKAILLICGRFKVDAEAEPLNLSEYNEVVRWLVASKLRPSDLFVPEHVIALSKATELPQRRLQTLLRRGVQLGFAVEGWQQSGLWVICRSDVEYPARLKKHLKDKAPPLLFGAGDRKLLAGGGLAIVGSRNVDTVGEDFTRDVADWCSRKGMTVVSGGARGVDSIAMSAALDAGGMVIGILADSLLGRSVSRDARYALSDGRLLLISPFHPESGFSVGNAMGRNKLIYAMADYALVISADHKKGGTWEGAVEELKRNPRRRVFVRISDDVPLGNRKLLELGAVEFSTFSHLDEPEVLFNSQPAALPPEPDEELPLFASKNGHRIAIRESGSAYCSKQANDVHVSLPDSSTIYAAVLPLLLAALKRPQSMSQLVEKLGETKGTLTRWIERAIAEKKVCKLKRPVRYSVEKKEA